MFTSFSTLQIKSFFDITPAAPAKSVFRRGSTNMPFYGIKLDPGMSDLHWITESVHEASVSVWVFYMGLLRVSTKVLSQVRPFYFNGACNRVIKLEPVQKS